MVFQFGLRASSSYCADDLNCVGTLLYAIVLRCTVCVDFSDVQGCNGGDYDWGDGERAAVTDVGCKICAVTMRGRYMAFYG